MKKTITYQDAGVDPEKAGKILSSFAGFMRGRPTDPSIISGIGPFASCYSLAPSLAGLKDPVLTTCCDGVGTKLKLALEWSNLKGLGQDLVAMNVNDLLCAGAIPLLFLDYYACSQLDENQLTELLKSIQAGCELAECSLVGGETAEMPGLYQKGDFDLAGFAVGIADRQELLGPERVKEGDLILGLASSGPHSNGYSLIRKIVGREGIRGEDKTPFDSRTWAATLLQPTTIYVRALKPFLKKVHALAHITGGGLFENLPRVIPSHLTARVSSEQWKIPPLFQWIQEKAGLNSEQLLSTLNAGVGMIAIVPETVAELMIPSLSSQGIPTWEIGRMEKASGSGSKVSWQ